MQTIDISRKQSGLRTDGRGNKPWTALGV